MRTNHFAGLVMTAGLFSAQVFATQVPGPLVDADWLASNKDDVVILDVRKDTKSFTAEPKKGANVAAAQGCGATAGVGIEVAGHIPGATLVDWGHVRTSRTVDGVDLIKLVPTKSEMEELMQSHGVNQGDAIVVVMKGVGSKDVTFGTRLYWQIKYWGHDNVALLDGGTAAWAAAGNQLSRDSSESGKGDWTAGEPNDAILATTSDVSRAVADGTPIVDARTEEFYLGLDQQDYVYAKGHVSGAKNFPHPFLVESNRAATFLPAADLASLMRAKGIDPDASSITYCDSGHLSTGQWFVQYELLGNKQVKQYDGSMHEWTKNEANPVTAMKSE